MSRTLPIAVQHSIAKDKSSVCHLLSFDVGQNAYRFAEDRIFYQGSSYQPSLRVISAVRYTEKLQLDPVNIQLQNITLNAARLLQQERAAIQGVEATLQRLF